MINNLETNTRKELSFDDFRTQVLADYRIACESREASLLGRKEVLTGKAKFGIFGDGKEVPQIAMAKFFKNGDFRSGYYRDQTFAFATGISNIEQFFSQLYADTNIEHDPFSAGRQMNSHFATPNIDENGQWLDLVNMKNTGSDMAPTAAQMPRSVGLAFASKLFRHVDSLKQFKHLSNNGNEVCFVTIGDASTSEGVFLETVNTAGVLQIPMAIFVWDDGYGISVPRKYQTTKNSISEALTGFQKTEKSNGIDIYKVKGWDYAQMCEVFEAGIQKIRDTHIPALFHVEELTQPQGHSTSGSHERYKTKERLAWEKEWDCNTKMREWILENALSTEEELINIEKAAKEFIYESKKIAWEKYITPINAQVQQVLKYGNLLLQHAEVNKEELGKWLQDLSVEKEPFHKDILKTTSKIIYACEHLGKNQVLEALKKFYNELVNEYRQMYNSHLYAYGANSVLNVPEIKDEYTPDSPVINGYEILNRYFDDLFSYHPTVFAFGEDVGQIGDVNQGFAGLQQKHGSNRIFDTGIRELTIIGQGAGMAFRGLRPIAEIQYLDYLIYGLQTLSDDVATLHYRTKGKQVCPLIIRTRGHRLEGIWHSGSPMQMLLGSLRGLHICVPRNMVKAAGMYNTLLKANEPALVIECLNGYRLKEKMPANIRNYTVPLGVPEVIREGSDVTIVSYGSVLRIAKEATDRLQELGVSCELIDVQTLLPFDIHHDIVKSLQKTNRILFLDEDVPGGGTAYMFQHVMEVQNGYRWLDVAPRTLSAQPHRPAYGTDGDYFSKPNAEEIIAKILEMMHE